LQQRGPQGGPLTVEAALAAALAEASAAGRWDVVALLARELEARRLAGDEKVVPLPRRGLK
jgi:hypothetical protein